MEALESNQEVFFAWARYLSWADLARLRVDEYFDTEGGSENPGHIGRFVSCTAQWFASLWVVVEGFRETGYQDSVVESILSNPPGHADLLRRCRNGVYHFQPRLIEPRFSNLASASKSALAWAHALHSEFIRFFWTYPERLGLRQGAADEWRQSAYEILGWLPSGYLWVSLTEYERKLAEYESAVPADDTSSEADALRKQTSLLRQEIDSLRARLRADQQKYQDEGWLDAIRSPDEPAARVQV